MTNRFRIRMALLLATILAATALCVSTAEAQQFGPWSAPVNLNNIEGCPAVVNSTSPDRNDTHPAISADGLSLYFASTRPGPDITGQLALGDYDLWVTHRATLDACWGPPVNLGQPVNSSGREFAPNLSPDGYWLFFHSKRPSICGNGAVQELWAVYRGDLNKEFGSERDPQQIHNLGCAINAVRNPGSGLLTDSAGPNFFDDGSGTLYLYFTRNAFPGDQDGFHIYVSTCSKDLYTCNTQGLWDQGIRVDALNSPSGAAAPFHRDTRTAIRHNGLEMILSSSRQGSLASENLWVSTRPSVTLDQQNWAPPEPLNCDDNTGFTSPNTGMFVPCSPWNLQGPLVNSAAFDGGPAISRDGTELYFFRVNPVNANNNIGLVCTEVGPEPQQDPPTGPGCRDLYVSKRKYITSTVLSSSANPSVVGQSITFTATVNSANDSPPTGTVTFCDLSCDGSPNLGTSALTSGQATLTGSALSIGSHSITGHYGGDRISGESDGTLTQNVEYGICPLYDQTRSVHAGAAFPIKLQLCDISGNDISSPTIIIHATSVTAVSGFSGTPDDTGNANPDNDFRFDATLGTNGGYIFNLSTSGLASGTYSLQFIAGSDPVTHSVNFGVK